MKLSENAAYLKGLAEGMNIAEATPNDKLLTKLLDLVAEMAATIELLEDRCDELTDYADELDADLGDSIRQYRLQCGKRYDGGFDALRVWVRKRKDGFCFR